MRIFDVHYRWMPSTFFTNIRSIFRSMRHGIGNVVRWTPVIWHDEDFDGEYLLHIMEWKLRKMSNYFSDYGCHVGSERDAREMLICAEAIRRIRSEDFNGNKIHQNYFSHEFYFKNYDARQKGFSDILFKIMNRRQAGWWD